MKDSKGYFREIIDRFVKWEWLLLIATPISLHALTKFNLDVLVATITLKV